MASHLSFWDLRQETVPRESKKKSPNQQIKSKVLGMVRRWCFRNPARNPPGMVLKRYKIHGIFTKLNWLAGFLPSTISFQTIYLSPNSIPKHLCRHLCASTCAGHSSDIHDLQGPHEVCQVIQWVRGQSNPFLGGLVVQPWKNPPSPESIPDISRVNFSPLKTYRGEITLIAHL